MFCPNCGNRVSDEDNYCKYCGKNIKNVEVTIHKLNDKQDKQDPKEDKKADMQSTIVFKPLNKLDDINSTDRIKNIIDEVDKKISDNIDKYKSDSYLTKDAQGPRKKDTDKIKDFSKDKQAFKTLTTKNKKITDQDLDSNLSAKEKVDPDKKEQEAPKKKRSLKEVWSDFINEDDDQFSIFSSMDEEMKKDNKNVKIASTTFQPESMENTMDIPKKEIEDALVESNRKIDLETNTINLDDKDSEKIEDLNTNIVFDKNNKNYEKALAKDNNKKQDVDKYESSEALSYKSFTDLVNKELNENKDKKLEDTSIDKESEDLDQKLGIIDKIKNKFEKTKDSIENSIEEKQKESKKQNPTQKEDKEEIKKESKKIEEDKKTDLTNKETFKEEKKEPLNTKDSKENQTSSDKKSTFKDFLFEKLLSFNKLMTKIDNKIKEKTSDNYIKVLLSLSFILSIIPIFISTLSISFSIIFLIIIKILLKLAQFYLSLSVTVDKAWIDTSLEEIKENFVFNYFICELFLLMGFLVSPFNGYLKFDFLSSLTPLPLATILVTILAVLISLWQYWDQLKKQSKIDFIAWYVIVFLVVDFSAKIFFVFANLIISN